MDHRQPSKNLHRPQPNTIMLVVFATLITTMLVASLLIIPYHSSSTHSHGHGHAKHRSLVSPLPPPPPPPPHPITKNACTNTFYPSLCFTTHLSSTSPSPSKNNSTVSLHYLLELTLNRTIREVKSTTHNLAGLFTRQDLKSQDKNALNDCTDMLVQTLYQLRQAANDLRKFPASKGSPRRSYGYIKTLLSAAITNENTCIDGFSDLEECNFIKGRKDLKEYLEGLLTPISHMISNCLAAINYTETIHYQETVIKNSPRLINTMPEDDFQDVWMMETGDRKMRATSDEVMPYVVVAKDGSGKHHTIQEAVSMAPTRSSYRYVIRIKAGTYRENVVIPRAKVNIVFVGDGMSSTVITGSRNFVDGFSTFTSATLAVVGDKFIARDLTIKNTAGPQKHQAVALRVNSNAAFYRCNIISYQDTLYAHSLRQFYHECTIQGTVDFIFGNAAAVFRNCLILIRKPNPGQSNMITAQGRQDPNQNTGIWLQNCTIVAAPDFTEPERANFSTFLGRPWRNYSRTIIMKSYLGDLIHPQGWHRWNQYSTLDTVEYVECMNSGPGSNTSGRVTWAGYKRNCSEHTARQFMVA